MAPEALIAAAVAAVALITWAVRVEQRGNEALRRIETLERQAAERGAHLEAKLDAIAVQIATLNVTVARLLGRLGVEGDG